MEQWKWTTGVWMLHQPLNGLYVWAQSLGWGPFELVRLVGHQCFSFILFLGKEIIKEVNSVYSLFGRENYLRRLKSETLSISFLWENLLVSLRPLVFNPFSLSFGLKENWGNCWCFDNISATFLLFWFFSPSNKHIFVKILRKLTVKLTFSLLFSHPNMS